MDFADISKSDLSALIDAMQSRLEPPYSQLALKRIVSSAKVEAISQKLSFLNSAGFTTLQIAMMLKAIVKERSARPRISDAIDLVTTGPEAPGTANRDTSVVVRNLFAKAKKSVVVVGYAVYQGQKVFEALANRMTEIPNLNVKMYLNLSPEADVSDESLLIRRFAEQFKTKQWPTGCRLPQVFFDPRSILPNRSERASLHAKCIVIDSEEVFISSANFTDRAHHRNIEVGIRVSSKLIAEQLVSHFGSLADKGVLKPAMW